MDDSEAVQESVVVIDATLATIPVVASTPADYGLIAEGALAIENGKIAWIGKQADLPSKWGKVEPWSAAGRLITPGLIDCHTHLIFAGDRRDEFAARAAGEITYAEQNEAGGGIQATVRATRAAGEESLLASAMRRAWWLIRQGVTAIEVKSGYGLDVETELTMLRVGRRLRELTPLRVRNTLLAGHVYPTDIDREEYVDMVCNKLLPAAYDSQLLDSIEVYCEESIGISLEDSSTILETAYRKKIPTRLQTDHLSDSAGAALAPSFYAKAAAHLNFTDDIGVEAMATAGTVAVLLPGAYLELGESSRPPPVALLRQSGVPIAVATGCNPGTSPLASSLVAAHLACVLFGLSPFEALRGLTTVPARVLSLDNIGGSLAVNAPADLAVWDAEHPEELIYWLGAPLWHAGWVNGRLIQGSKL